MRSPRNTNAANHARRQGFTLIELMVVVTIMMLLIGIGVTLGPTIAGRGSEQMTRSVLSISESVLTEYQVLTGRWPNITETNNYPYTRIGAAADTVGTLNIGNDTDFRERSIQRFVARTLQTTATDNDRVSLRRRSSINSLYEELPRTVFLAPTGSDYMTIHDGWGTPILYVPPMRMIHPDDQAVWDNHMHFLPLRDTPYFVSAGPSGRFGNVHADPGTADHDASLDNIYSYDVVN